jgi:hypothetical protein
MVTALETRLKHVGGMAEEHGRYLAQVYLLWLDLRRLYEYLLRLYLLWQIGEALFAKNAVAHRFRTGAVVPSFAPPPAGSGTAVRAGAAAVAAAEQPPGFGAYATGASPSPTPTPTPTLPLTPAPNPCPLHLPPTRCLRHGRAGRAAIPSHPRPRRHGRIFR